ncbi:MAG: T9SS type A sorting domain-containing protein [Chitinophagaceae bacterium]|nr:T9SS type A sorting domain-containing protein [Chitinophagaceae bacterium]
MYIESLQPSLVENSSFLTVLESKAGRLVLKVLDIDGRLAKTVITAVEEGNQQIDLNMSDLSSGAYVLNAFFKDSFIKSIRFIKQ